MRLRHFSKPIGISLLFLLFFSIYTAGVQGATIDVYTICDDVDCQEVDQLQIAFDTVAIDRATQTIRSALHIESTLPILELDISVEATITEMVWDNTRRNYRDRLHDTVTIPVAENLAITTDNLARSFPLELSLPPTTGLWKLRLQVVLRSDVEATTSSYTALFHTYAPASIGPGEPFTIAVFPDIQYSTSSYPNTLTRMCEWLLANNTADPVAFVLQMGDATNNNSPAQWDRVLTSFSMLNGTTPYAFALGNHDMAGTIIFGYVAHRGRSLFQHYFGPENLAGLQGSYPAGRLDNTYHVFNVGGTDYLVVSLEFTPPDDALAWANAVVAAHPTHKVIVITHEYLGSSGKVMPQGSTTYPISRNKATTVNDGEFIWSKFASRHSNIFLVLSGHYGVSNIPYRVDKGVNGNNVYSMLVDFQGEPHGGDGWMALLHFTPDNKIQVRAYSPYLEAYKANSGIKGFGSNFTIDMNTGKIQQE